MSILARIANYITAPAPRTPSAGVEYAVGAYGSEFFGFDVSGHRPADVAVEVC